MWGLQGHRLLGKGSSETGCGKGSPLPGSRGLRPGPRAALEGKAEVRPVPEPSSPTRVTSLCWVAFCASLGVPGHLCQSSQPSLLVKEAWPFNSVPLSN